MEFLASHYEEFIPTERADVILCEMLSSMMLVEQQIQASSYAVKHFLKHDGVILPQQVSVYVVPVESPELWNRFEIEGLHFPMLPQTLESNQYKDLADLVRIHVFDLTQENMSQLKESISFKVIENGVIHGLVGMFECQLYNDIILKMKDGWKELLIPLENPINVQPGDEVIFNIEYTPGKYDTLQVMVEI
jgi:predicted RNA methylase